MNVLEHMPCVQYAKGVATVKLSDAVKHALERYLERSGETRQQVLEQALRRYLRARGEAIDVTEADETEADEAVGQQAAWLMLLEQHAHLASLQGQHPLALRMAAHAGKLLASPRTVTRLLETINASPAAWLATLPSEHRTVTALAFSPDGRYLASVGRDQRGYLWDWHERRSLAQFETVSSITRALAFSPDGRMLAVGSGSALELFDIDIDSQDIDNQDIDNQDIRLRKTPLHGHKAWLVDVTFDPSGRFVASASHDKHVRLWDVREHAAASLPIGQHEDWVTCVAFAESIDETPTRLASGGANGSVVLYVLKEGLPEGTDVPRVLETDHRSIAEDEQAYAHVPLSSEPWQLEPLEVLYGHSAPLRSLLFVEDILISADADGVLIVWDSAGDMVFSSESATGIAALACHETGVVSAHDDGSVSLWQWGKDGQSLELTPQTNQGQTNQGRTNQGQSLISQQAPQVDRDHLPATSFDNSEPHGDTPRLPDVSFVFASSNSPWGNVWASGSREGAIDLWQPQQHHPLGSAAAMPFPCTALVSHPHAPLAAISQGTDIVLWDLCQRQTLVTLRGHRSSVKGLAFSADGQYLATAGADRTVRLWELTISDVGGVLEAASATLLTTLQGHNNVVLSVAFSPDGRYLASGGVDGSIIVWSLPEGTPQLTLRGQLNWVEGLAFQPEGNYLASVSGSTLLLWDVAAWEHNKVRLWGDPMRGNYDAMLSLALLQEQVLTAAGACLLVWDVENQQLEHELERVHSDTITCVAVHPEGTYWATAGFDGHVWLWDAASRQPLACLGVHRDVVNALAFSADGCTLLSVGADKTLWQWQIGMDAWLAAADARAGYLLTPEEWSKALPNVPFVAVQSEE